MSNEPRDPKLNDAEEQWLDRMLDTAAPVEPSATLRRVVAEIPLRHPHPHGASERGFGLPAFIMSFGLLAAVSLLSFGAWVGSQADVLSDIAMIDDPNAGQADEAWEELAVLAFADELDEELVP